VNCKHVKASRGMEVVYRALVQMLGDDSAVLRDRVKEGEQTEAKK